MKIKKSAQPACGYFKVLSETFKPQHNETILSLQYCKLIREQSENAEGLKGHLKIQTNICKYKERDRILKEQFITGLNDDYILAEIMIANHS